MIWKLTCDDLSEEDFDEIDVSSSSTKKVSCAHYDIEIKTKSENFKFLNYCIRIVCKKCNYEFKNVYKKNKYDLTYCCDNCNPQSTINFSYKNTNENDNEIENENENKINNNPIEENIEKEIINNEHYFNFPLKKNCIINLNNGPLINNEVNGGQYSQNENKIGKVYHTPGSDGKKERVYKTYQRHKSQLIIIKFQFNNKVFEEEFNYFEPLEKQLNKIKEDLEIPMGKNIELYENSEPLDKNKSPQDLHLIDGMIIEIEIDN